MGIFPEAIEIISPKLLRLWNKWEIRVSVLFSLLLQFLLILLGSRRKYIRSTWISIVLWLSYLSADWIATVSLGILANGNDEAKDNSENPNDPLQAFWAPFLLLHLGGPDTITAYALEDNELWLRHALMLLVQLIVALYVFSKSLTNTAITYVTVPMFIAGVTKYGERTWVLRSASAKQFEDSLLSTPAEETYQRVPGLTSEKQLEKSSSSTAPAEVVPQSKDPHFYLREAYFLFCMFKHLFANFSLSIDDAQYCYFIIGGKEPREAFKLIEIELGFLYDILYTKATMIYSAMGFWLRAVSFLSTVSALFVFSIFVEKKTYSPIDVKITYALLIGAIALECYAVVLLLLSDWALLWLSKHKLFSTFICPPFRGFWSVFKCKEGCFGSIAQHKLFSTFICPAFRGFRSVFKCKERCFGSIAQHKLFSKFICPAFHCFRSVFTSKGRCFGSIAQHNLIKFCLKEKKSKFLRWDRVFSFYFMLKTYINRAWEDELTDALEIEIFNYVHGKYKTYKEKGFEDKFLIEVLAYRGGNVLKEKKCLDKFKWSVVDVEFNHSLLLWHIATDICYYNDLKKDREEVRVRSKCLSDYMLYILLMRPFMLPKWIGRIGYLQHTYKEAMRLFCSEGLKHEAEACKVLLHTSTQNDPLESMNREKRSKSLLSDGCRLAKQLLRREDRWEIIIGVWLEMLTHAASECGWRDHAQQLRRGGELLTKVCLLMANMGLSTQYQRPSSRPGSEANQVGWSWGRSRVRSSLV